MLKYYFPIVLIFLFFNNLNCQEWEPLGSDDFYPLSTFSIENAGIKVGSNGNIFVT